MLLYLFSRYFRGFVDIAFLNSLESLYLNEPNVQYCSIDTHTQCIYSFDQRKIPLQYSVQTLGRARRCSRSDTFNLVLTVEFWSSSDIVRGLVREE